MPPSPFLVLDTNIVLDLLLFADLAVQPVRQALQGGELQWIATQRMHDELARVLQYPQIAPRLDFYGTSAAVLLQQMAARSTCVEVAARCDVICKDADDQCFIDLAVAHGAVLLSKDKYVLRLRKRLAARGVHVAPALPVGFAGA